MQRALPKNILNARFSGVDSIWLLPRPADQSGLSLVFETAEDRAIFFLPENLHVLESHAAEPHHLLFPRRPRPIEVQKTAARFHQRIGVLINAANNIGAADVVNRD